MSRHTAWLLFNLAVLLLALVPSAEASSLRIASPSATRGEGEVEADFTITRVLLDEVAGDSVPITIFFDPQQLGVESVDVFTNLNRRDKAAADPDGRGVQEGISPPSGTAIATGDDRHYFKAYRMDPVSGGYRLTLAAQRCGAYRLTVRYRLVSDPPGMFRWYGDELNAQGLRKRDHAVIASPKRVRDLQIYEANPPTITATGITSADRGTFAKLARSGPPAGPMRFSLDYLRQLGVNTLWLQPIHPRGIAGRQIDPATHQPFVLGSPYAVKDFFAVMPALASGFTPGGTPASDDSPAGRAQALVEFRSFADAAAAAGMGIFLDVQFNHTAQDIELSEPGQSYWGNATTNALSELRDVEARVFSRADAYDMLAHDAASIAVAPDRYDFGKFTDVSDIYFGRYAALVANAAQSDNYRNEGDWFDPGVGSEDSSGTGNGHFDAITQRVWQFFGDYLQFWLTQSGYPDNPGGVGLRSTAPLLGMRADFAQGLPPQAWEYIINRTRARRWDFIFMAESLDGGPVTYRSSRHFDVLNDNLIYELHHAQTAADYQRIYDARSAAYGGAPVLLNTTSQDEDNYRNPYEAAMRFAVNSTIDGVPMIFPGQELGLAGTVVPPSDTDPAAGAPFGYDVWDVDPVAHKPIPSFKTYNSMMPLWQALSRNSGDAVHLLPLYTAIAAARAGSPALRSPHRRFLSLTHGGIADQLYAVGKVQTPGGDPVTNDVIFAFVNLAVADDTATPSGSTFDINVDIDQRNIFGIRPDHTYNVRNIAAYGGSDPHRSGRCLWGAGQSGSDLLANGIFVRLNRVPADELGWASAPFEPQYLKLLDMTAGNTCAP
jgi:hypothetical protein